MKQIAIIDGGYISYEFEQQLFASRGYELAIGMGKKERGVRIANVQAYANHPQQGF